MDSVRTRRHLPASHPAVRWASVHAIESPRRPRPQRRTNPIRRSLGRYVDTGFRPDIEGLRAIAVVAVIVYHARLFGVHGGFIGVDVFFVVSGFLITRLILGEVVKTGRLSLAAFWGRRARRLLAASALVVVVTAFAAHVVLPPLTQRTVVTDVVAAATFSSNLVFAGRLGSYFGAQLGLSTPSPMLHFWSLAVEEQFYLCWPPLLAVLARRPRQYRRLLLTTIAIGCVLGFTLAAWLTPRGAVVGVLPPADAHGRVVGRRPARRPRHADQEHPGHRPRRAGLDRSRRHRRRLRPLRRGDAVAGHRGARPRAGHDGGDRRRLGGTGAVVAGASPRHRRDAVDRAPLLCPVPVALAGARPRRGRLGPLNWVQRVAAVVIAVGLSALSFRFVEDPVRHTRWLAAVPARSLAFGAAMVLVMLSAGWALARSIPTLDGGQAAAAPELVVAAAPTTVVPTIVMTTPPAASPTSTASPTTTTVAPTTVAPLTAAGAPTGELAALVASMQDVLATASEPAPVPSNLRPSISAARNRALPYTKGCVNVGVNARLLPCEFGVPGAERTILLYGDSHAVQWFEPLERIAQQRGLRLVLLAKGGCPVTDVVVPTPVLRHTCPPYRDAAIAWIEEHRPALVVVANSYTHTESDGASWATGAEASMARLAAVAPHVVVIGDNPSSRSDPPACLSAHLDDASACATARAEAIRPDLISGEVAAARAHGTTFVDTTDWFCTPTSCPAVIGDLLVMRDETHLTPPMAEFLTPLLEAVVAPLLDG